MKSVDKTNSPTTIQPPDFSVADVAAVVTDKFGLTGNYEQLVSERDQNFRLKTPEGRRFVVKVTGRAEDRIATDFQIEMLSHFEDNEFDLAPRVCTTQSGQKRSTISSDDGTEYSLRVVTYLDGALLHDVGLTTKNVTRFGQRLAELDLSLASFEFDGDGQAGLWDMQEFLQLQELLSHVGDTKVRKYTGAVLARFEESILPALRSMPKQAIHNDANPENILMNEHNDVSGFIDFGDALKAPRIIEVAIAASYLRTKSDDPLELISPFVNGYHQKSPLTAAELNLLFDLIRTRLAMTLIIMYWRLMARDEDDPYRQKTIENESNAFDLLVFLTDLGQDDFNHRLNIGEQG
ncbi:MAG: phosphotransferase [Woeseiaceae bacterium]